MIGTIYDESNKIISVGVNIPSLDDYYEIGFKGVSEINFDGVHFEFIKIVFNDKHRALLLIPVVQTNYIEILNHKP